MTLRLFLTERSEELLGIPSDLAHLPDRGVPSDVEDSENDDPIVLRSVKHGARKAGHADTTNVCTYDGKPLGMARGEFYCIIDC